MLKAEAVPTLFAYNKYKQPQKRKSSETREKARAKRQLCEDAVHHNALVQSFDFECNTKETQTDPEVKPQMVDIGVQCNIGLVQHEEQYVPISSSDETQEEDKDENRESDDEYSEENKDVQECHQEISITPSKTAFIVYWTC